MTGLALAGPIAAGCPDVPVPTVYAGTFATGPNKVVIVAIDKSLVPEAAALKVTAGVSYWRAKVFTVTAAGGANVIARPDIAKAASNAWLYAMPAPSVSVIVPPP